MSKSNEILAKMEMAACKMYQLHQEPRDFGGGVLYASEVHTIKAIKEHENVNITCLAQSLKVTKGAICKVVNRLVEKGYVTKYKEEENRKEVHLNLTEIGEITYENYMHYITDLHLEIIDFLSQYDEEKQEDILEIMCKFVNVVEDHIKKTK